MFFEGIALDFLDKDVIYINANFVIYFCDLDSMFDLALANGSETVFK